MCPYIARVCGFARGEAECKTTNECNIRAHNARVWYPISDLLHLRNDVLIGYAYIALGENLCFYENSYACVQKSELCSYISHTY